MDVQAWESLCKPRLDAIREIVREEMRRGTAEIIEAEMGALRRLPPSASVKDVRRLIDWYTAPIIGASRERLRAKIRALVAQARP